MNKQFSITEVSNSLGVSKSIIAGWEKTGKLVPHKNNDTLFYTFDQLIHFNVYQEFRDSNWKLEHKIKPHRAYSSIELFAGAGGLALGLEKSGFEVALLNEIDKFAGATQSFSRRKCTRFIKP